LIGQSALVESPLYRRGEELMPWQRAFVTLFNEQRELNGKCRLLLADEGGRRKDPVHGNGGVGFGPAWRRAGADLMSSHSGHSVAD